MSTPIVTLPPNSCLPAAVHQLADEWRSADQRVKTLETQRAAAHAAIPQARLDDAAAIRTAVLNDAPLPQQGAKEHQQFTRIQDAERRLPVAKHERDVLGNRLAVALRADECRKHLTDQAQHLVRPAVRNYLTALEEAERLVGKAHAQLIASSSLIAVIRALDTGKTVQTMPTQLGGVPSYHKERTAAQQLLDTAEQLTKRQSPNQRHIRLRNGREVHVTADLAAEFHRDRAVIAWLDGWPPEAPAPAVSTPKFTEQGSPAA